MWPFVQVLEMRDAGQDAHEEREHFPIWHVHNTLLRDCHFSQLGGQADLVGKLSPSHHQRMLGQHPMLQLGSSLQPALYGGTSDLQRRSCPRCATQRRNGLLGKQNAAYLHNGYVYSSKGHNGWKTWHRLQQSWYRWPVRSVRLQAMKHMDDERLTGAIGPGNQARQSLNLRNRLRYVHGRPLSFLSWDRLADHTTNRRLFGW
jgi:hypothetical protein